MNCSCKLIVHAMLAGVLVSGCKKDLTGSRPVQFSEPVLDSCTFEPDHHYWVSVPENLPDDRLLPLILAIDPHGDGKLGLEHFTGAMKDIPAVVGGSDKIMNNDPGFEQSLSSLQQDVLAKYPADPDRVIIAGFSGGARMAYYYGMKHRAAGIIMYGAGPDRSGGQTGNTRISLASGTRDFNFMEQYLPPFSGIPGEKNQMVDFFRGTHEWPPPATIYESVAYILKDDPGLPGDIPARITEQMLLAYDSLTGAGDLFFAAKSLEKAWVFAPDKKQKASISRTIGEFKTTPGWVRSTRKFEGYLKNELSLKQSYVAKLADPDTAWWNAEIRNLDEKIRSGTDPGMVDFLYRLRGFIGIILYSQINSLLQNGVHTDTLDRLMTIYELAEPDSPDLVKFKGQVHQLR